MKKGKTKRIKQNEPLSSLAHLIGAGLAVAGLVLLVVFASLRGTAWHIVGFSIFGAGAILLYSTSALYHFICRTSKAKNIFQRLDHAMIYFFIAATYTPVCFILKNRGLGWTLFGIIWALAITGIVLRSTGITVRKWLPLVVYLAMGWMGVTALSSLVEFLPHQAAWWLLAGGMSYTIGAIFFALDNFIPRRRWIGMHEVFHFFVIAGSFSHFWFMFRYVLYA